MGQDLGRHHVDAFPHVRALRHHALQDRSCAAQRGFDELIGVSPHVQGGRAVTLSDYSISPRTSV